MRIELFLAFKLMRDARAQSVLIVAGVAVGVAVVVFLSALITGLQRDLIGKTVGSQPHVVVEPATERPRPLRPDEPDQVVLERVEEVGQRVRSIDGWQQLRRRLTGTPGVTAVSPAARGPALAVRGGAQQSVQVVGVELEQFVDVVDLREALQRGQLSVAGRDALIGERLAADLGVDVGDTLRVRTADGQEALLDVRGVFELGARTADESWVVVSLRSGQSLLALPGGATSIELTVADVFAAETLAARLRAQTGLEVESWMESNAELLTALRSQSASSGMIQVFVLLAVAIGIASVLVVSVVQRKREVGILRAMGMSRRRTQRVFLIQGAVVGLLGSMAGSALGALLATVFRDLAAGPAGEPLFPVALEARLFLTASAIATAVGLAAAVLPARRAARLDPVEAIRHE